MKKLLALVTTTGYLTLTKVALADQTSINLGQASSGNGIGAGTDLTAIIKNIFTLVFTVSALLVLAMLIFGAIQWILSGGDKTKVDDARKRIINALIGLAVLSLSFVIVSVVGNIVGFNVLTGLKLPTLSSGG